MSRPFLCLLIAAVFISVGCKKEESVPEDLSTNSPAPPSPRGAGPMPVTTKAGVVTDTGDINKTLAQLTAELRDYVIRTRSVPKNFDEFATKSGVQFPPPPQGKKYAIEGQAVVLVKN